LPDITDKPPGDIFEELARLEMQLDMEIPAKSLDRNLLIATWNIRSLGGLTKKWRADEDDSPVRDFHALRAIAEIVSRFDVIAVQEVRSNLSAFRHLARALGPHWGYVMTDVTRGKKGNYERMAFLFDTRKIRMSGLASELVVPPERMERISSQAMRRQFARTPYAVGFETHVSPTDDPISFVLVTLHVLYGESPEERLPEIKEIADWLADWAQSVHAFNSNLIALGDFNIDRRDDPLYRAFTSTGLEIPGDLHEIPRTLFSDPDQPDTDHFYDQIAWFTGKNDIPALNIHYNGGGGFDFTKTLYKGRSLTKNQISWRISDHYPLWAEFTT
jgi:endonuclease/exonuclease/phosphatase family metal-dependent hydrolase